MVKDEASRKNILRVSRLSIIAMLWILAAAAVWRTWTRLPTPVAPAAPTESGKIIELPAEKAAPTQMPEFSLVNCDGRTIGRSDLLGHPVVFSFVFTHCTSTCPTITRQMQTLHERMSDRDVLFVTITVDPKRDTPEVLKQYAESYAADLDRWLFLTGPAESIYQLINEGFGLAAKELFGEQRQPGLEIAHTNRVVLVNSDGEFEATYLATEPKDVAKLRIKLKQLTQSQPDNAALEATSPVSPAQDKDAENTTCLVTDEAESTVVTNESKPADRPDWPEQGIAEFELQECQGRSVTREDLLGRQVVVCFVFTRCAGPCPQVSLRMRELQDRLESKQQLSAFALPVSFGGGTGQLLIDSLTLADQIALDRIPEFQGERIRLVSITVDPKHDTPEVLRAYAATFEADPQRWWFLTGAQQAIYELITQSFRQIVQELTGDDRRPGFEVIHTTNLLHLDALGRVRGKYNARKDADMAMLRRSLTTGRTRSDRDPVVLALLEQKSPSPQADNAEAISDPPTESSVIATPAVDSTQGASTKPLNPSNALFPDNVPGWVRTLPLINALLNGTATILLLVGYVWIRRGQRQRHKWAMLLAFTTSIVFLGCYATYHVALRNYTGSGSIRFLGTGWIRPVYYTILLTHVVLAAAVPVLTSITIWRAIQARWDAHRKIAKITFPIWLYVSVTGVMIYLILYHWPVSA